MTRHAYPTMPDDRTREKSRPADPSDFGEWEEAAEREASDAPALAEADHQILADDDLDDDDEDVEDGDVDDDPEEEDEDEAGADDEDDDDDFDDEDDEDEDDEEATEDEK